MSNHLQAKKILIGITGGIAAYKVLELIRRLKEQEAEVKVVMTAAAKSFVTPLSVQALTGNKIHDTLLDADNEAAMSHIELARWADVLLIAPASANFIAKYAQGMADDLLTTVCLATTASVIIAPAMNQQMWLHSATQQNIQTLQQRQVTIIGPGNGSQACGEFGPGRMLEAHDLLQSLALHFAPKTLAGKHILITAGPTQEAIDPVRFISNHSSGKMGYALAQAAIELGAQVTLISGPTTLQMPHGLALAIQNVVSAKDMYAAVIDCITQGETKVDIFIGCAAVADYQPVQAPTQKIKKIADTISLECTRTPDILAAVAALPSQQRPYTIGFAAETENLEQNARLKLQNKQLDLIIANTVGNGEVFNKDYNEVIIINKDTTIIALPKLHKTELAFKILNTLVAI